MKCDEARKLVPPYQDGELREPLAGPLRQHLLGCGACREIAKAELNLKRWFRTPAAPAAPPGFAAHVARRAFAGDAGYSSRTVETFPGAFPAAAPQRAEGPVLPFVLRLTAVAAAALLVLAVGLRVRSLPESSELGAESLSEVIQIIEALDAAEEAAEAAPDDEPAGPTGAPGARSEG